MAISHTYDATVEWTGNLGEGTRNYRTYSRDHDIIIDGKKVISGSSDPAFRGDANRHNPEDMLVASISACHMLWYLHLCSVNKINVTAYNDDAKGMMEMNKDGSGQFSSVVLHPHVTIGPDGNTELAISLHKEAHKMCFIARSLNFPVLHEPVVTKQPDET